MGKSENFQTGDQVLSQQLRPSVNGAELLLAQAPGQTSWKAESTMQTASLVDAGSLPPLQLEPALTQVGTEAMLTAMQIGCRAVSEVARYTWDHTWNPYRGKELQTVAGIPENGWHEAYKAFPELSVLPKAEATRLMKAIVLNELDHYDLKDQAQDAGLPLGETFGISQLSRKAITNHAEILQQQVNKGQRHTNPLAQYRSLDDAHLKAVLLDTNQAPLLVAENLAYNIRQYNRHGYPITTETLAYGYNPDIKRTDRTNEIFPALTKVQDSTHVRNVMGWYHFLESAERSTK